MEPETMKEEPVDPQYAIPIQMISVKEEPVEPKCESPEQTNKEVPTATQSCPSGAEVSVSVPNELAPLVEKNEEELSASSVHQDMVQNKEFNPVESEDQSNSSQITNANLEITNTGTLVQPQDPTTPCSAEDLTYRHGSIVEVGVTESAAVAFANLVCAVRSKVVLQVQHGESVEMDIHIYWCNFCTFKSETIEKMLQHGLDHRFQCKYCKYQSFSRTAVINHSVEEHPAFAETVSNLKYCSHFKDILHRHKAQKRKACTSPSDETSQSKKSCNDPMKNVLTLKIVKSGQFCGKEKAQKSKPSKALSQEMSSSPGTTDSEQSSVNLNSPVHVVKPASIPNNPGSSCGSVLSPESVKCCHCGFMSRNQFRLERHLKIKHRDKINGNINCSTSRKASDVKFESLKSKYRQQHRNNWRRASTNSVNITQKAVNGSNSTQDGIQSAVHIADTPECHQDENDRHRSVEVNVHPTDSVQHSVEMEDNQDENDNACADEEEVPQDENDNTCVDEGEVPQDENDNACVDEEEVLQDENDDACVDEEEVPQDENDNTCLDEGEVPLDENDNALVDEEEVPLDENEEQNLSASSKYIDDSHKVSDDQPRDAIGKLAVSPRGGSKTECKRFPDKVNKCTLSYNLDKNDKGCVDDEEVPQGENEEQNFSDSLEYMDGTRKVSDDEQRDANGILAVSPRGNSKRGCKRIHDKVNSCTLCSNQDKNDKACVDDGEVPQGENEEQSFSDSSDDSHKVSDDQHTDANRKLVLLPIGKRKTGCKRVYDKESYCTFCGAGFRSKISRHILNRHKHEPRVRDVLSFPIASRARRVKLELLSNEGNFKNNLKVLKTREGGLVVGRRPMRVTYIKNGDYLPCDYCKKFIMKQRLWLHQSECYIKKFIHEENGILDTSGRENWKEVLRLSRQLLNSALMKESQKHVGKILHYMPNDTITKIVRQDDIIRRYAELTVESLGSAHQHLMENKCKIATSCRILARLVKKCRELSTHTLINLNQLICPEMFDLVVNAIKAMRVDNIALLSGKQLEILEHAIQIKKGISLRNTDVEGLQEAENFHRKFELKWKFPGNIVHPKKQNVLTKQKVETIPLTEDLQLLTSYILTAMQNTTESLQKEATSETWTRLAELTLCRLMLFNKPRRAEVKDMKVDEYEKEQSGELQVALSTTDKMLADRMDIIICHGRSKKSDAYVILPLDAKNAVTLLNSTRHEAGVELSNPYIFAQMNSDLPLMGDTDLEDIVDRCTGLRYPEIITATTLRPYIATVSKVLELSTAELESLARHLGQDVPTHDENYSLSHSTRELTIVSQLLLAVERGYVNRWRGLQLADISIDELPDVQQFCKGGAKAIEFAKESRSIPTLCKSSQAMVGKRPVVEEEDASGDIDDCIPLPSDSPHSSQSSEMNTSGVSPRSRRYNGWARNNPDYITSLAEDESPMATKDTSDVNWTVIRTPTGKKRPWTIQEESFLMKKFEKYLKNPNESVHNSDMLDAQRELKSLSTRTLAQIRSKLNNIKLGK